MLDEHTGVSNTSSLYDAYSDTLVTERIQLCRGNWLLCSVLRGFPVSDCAILSAVRLLGIDLTEENAVNGEFKEPEITFS
jgi:hypothetical protein